MTIGSAGGTVSLANGPALNFSSGALAKDTTVTIQNAGQTSPDGGPVFEFLPAGLQFPASSVLVTIPIPAGLTSPAVFWTQLGSTTAFDVLPTAVNGTDATAYVSHFSSGYAGNCGVGTNVCQDSFSGTSSSAIGPTSIDASITWLLDPTAPLGVQKGTYYPVGTVSVHAYTDTNGCLVSYEPASYAINGHNNGGLTVDRVASPSTFSGQGISEWQAAVTKTCPDGSGGTSVPVPTGGAWFMGQGTVADKGMTIAGTWSGLGQTFNYSFKR